MRRLGAVVGIVFTLGGTHVGLAGGGDREQVKLTAADQAAARAVVIRGTDLQALGGWKGGPRTPDLSPNTCANYHPKQSDLVVTGAAESFWQRQDRAVTSEDQLLQTARMVGLDWQRSVNARALACALTRGGARQVSVTKVAVPRIAPLAAGFRAFYTLETNGQTIRIVLEAAAVARGRHEISVGEVMDARTQLTVLHADVVRLARAMLARAGA